MSSLKDNARKLFSPLLNRLEGGDEPCTYTPRSRLILWVMSGLFLALGAGLGFFVPEGTDPAFLIPVTVFCVVGLLGMSVAWLGTDRAVARLWRNR